jgi:dipeptidyl aminopeptidase/acylaminoacyl peptidase
MMKNILTIKTTLLLLGLVLSATALNAQTTLTDYKRADSLFKNNERVYSENIQATWIPESHNFWYINTTAKGKEFWFVNADKQTKTTAFDHEKLAKKISEVTGKKELPFKLPIKKVNFLKDQKSVEFIIDTVKWKYTISDNSLKKVERIKNQPEKDSYWGDENEDDRKGKPILSPDKTFEAFIKNFNVYIREIKTKKESQLSFDGSEGDYYSTWLNWSPDSKKLATCKVRANTKHTIYFVQSSPLDQQQPKLESRDYLKPGDALPIKRPVLFNIEEKKQIAINTIPFENQYSLDLSGWRKDSKALTFEFNQRGHQAYQIASVNAETGEVKVIIDEQCKTFFDYSGKKYRFDVSDGKEIIWASERDGWNHLYLFDGQTGTIKNQITKGEWVVREVVNVDTLARQIIFKGAGKELGKDPYLVHYYRINFDGTNLIDLTPEDADHSATFSSDWKYFVDSYSRVDLSSTHVLRQSTDGKIIKELEKADITELLKTGWKMPEVFSAKGRDGMTDIWGIIIRPSNFDATKKYPIIEYIYAGPHSAFVPKSFAAYNGSMSPLAELGFIVVQIDGMGTSLRSKAFHDVCWKNLKDAGFPDRILWMKAAAEKYPYMDITRVGIHGTSAGGQNAMGAVLFHPEFYKVSVSSCGCHDNRMDKMWWNEAWMSYPIGPQYDSCSNVTNAFRLKGKLLLMVGEVDDNVDPATTMQVVNALIKANKEFDLLVLPGMNHTAGGKYGERRRRDFFVKNLLGSETPDWNKIEP